MSKCSNCENKYSILVKCTNDTWRCLPCAKSYAKGCNQTLQDQFEHSKNIAMRASVVAKVPTLSRNKFVKMVKKITGYELLRVKQCPSDQIEYDNQTTFKFAYGVDILYISNYSIRHYVDRSWSGNLISLPISREWITKLNPLMEEYYEK